MKINIKAIILTLVLSGLLFFIGMDARTTGDPYEVFQVYLNGEKIGLIKSDTDLYIWPPRSSLKLHPTKRLEPSYGIKYCPSVQLKFVPLAV